MSTDAALAVLRHVLGHVWCDLELHRHLQGIARPCACAVTDAPRSRPTVSTKYRLAVVRPRSVVTHSSSSPFHKAMIVRCRHDVAQYNDPGAARFCQRPSQRDLVASTSSAKHDVLST